MSQLVEDGWDSLKIITSEELVDAIVQVLKINNSLPGIEKYSNEEIWEAVEKKHSESESKTVEFSDLKSPEWDVLTKPNPPTDFPHFLSERTTVPSRYAGVLEEVLLMKTQGGECSDRFHSSGSS